MGMQPLTIVPEAVRIISSQTKGPGGFFGAFLFINLLQMFRL